jgi:hypothetical protein
MIVYFLGCALLAAATSTYALFESAESSISTPASAIAVEDAASAAVAPKESLLQHARRSSLNERVRRLRASSDDYVESARLLADRADSLSQRTELLLEERKSTTAKELQQRRQQQQAMGTTATLRLRKNKQSMEEDHHVDDCDADRCTSVCISDCNFVCSNPIFERPSECDTPQFCQTTCSSGCEEDACKFRFATDDLSSLIEPVSLVT